ncbi:reverse transcriptase domain-containing protein [Caerostris extrusa]|uniref:Reverse transcriptase domain-containing protein n=1 Tax=Caerostris extrusa TaxID=172846 RepID=A0AAV4PA23_CAEEX|nr:reverse transcriptase domain-containing protein [Caerostris extrusa]
MSKTMERRVYNRLNWYLESHSLLAEEQVGFRKFKSTTHHVALFSQAIKDALDSKQVLTAIAVDLKSAYDTVWKENLLFKLNNMGISGHLLNWIKSLLSQRLCRVRYGDGLSKTWPSSDRSPSGSGSELHSFQ